MKPLSGKKTISHHSSCIIYKSFKQNFRKLSPKIYKKIIIHHEQVGSDSRNAKLVYRLKINVIHHINKLKRENNMIVSTDEEKTLDKI